jgi:threonine dehydratase
MTAERPSLRDLSAARRRTAGRLRATPLARSAALSAATGGEVWLKLEHQQITGSFKLRGATNAVLALSEVERARGVVGVSTGNHGRGLAHAARAADTACIICMSNLVPRNKIEGIEALGAEVRIVGKSQDEAQVEVDRLVAEDGMTMLPPFDHADIIAGQGTLGLEVMEQAPETETVIVPVSGGGLIAGVALAVKGVNPQARVIGVTMEHGAAMYESQRAGRPVEVEELPTLADSLGGGIGLDNRYTFAMVRELVDDMVLVSEQEIAAAIAQAYWREGQIVEGSGAVGIAALRAGRITPRGRTVVLMTGGNIDPALHHELISTQQPEG